MKKALSILLSLLFILTVMHLSVASHYCRGNLASTRVNFSGKTAGCGMESNCSHKQQHGTTYDSHCCTDVVKIYAVDNVYASSTAVKVLKTGTVDYVVVPGLTAQMHATSCANHLVLHPPGPPPISGVSLSDIRVFRI
jgi:hypothetical protein